MRRTLAALVLAMTPPLAVLPVPSALAQQVVVVRSGETLSEIAERHGVSLTRLMQANGISDADLVVVGQRLTIPGSGSTTRTSSAASTTQGTAPYTVKSGETLSEIADRFNTTTERLIQINAIRDPNLVMSGTRLQVPMPARRSTPAAAAAPAVNRNASEHVVQPGESLSLIAERYNTSVTRLVALNQLEDPELVMAGTRLKLRGTPPAPRRTPPPAAQPKPAATASAPTPAAQPVAATTATTPAAATQQPATSSQPASQQTPTPQAPNVQAATLQSPTPQAPAVQATPAQPVIAQPSSALTTTTAQPAILQAATAQAATAKAATANASTITAASSVQPALAQARSATSMAAANPTALNPTALNPTALNPTATTAAAASTAAASTAAATSAATAAPANVATRSTPAKPAATAPTATSPAPAKTSAVARPAGDWRNYGPLQVDWSKIQPMGGSYVAPSLNSEGQALYLAVNCTARKINVTSQAGQWRNWENPSKDFEHKLVQDICQANRS
jgi:LysM repeat protein